MKRPMVVEAYMTHSRTPVITEVLRDGRIRKVGRKQLAGPSAGERELKQILSVYGRRWTGIRKAAV